MPILTEYTITTLFIGAVIVVKLPILLAGPILRRVEQSEAYIWIAMSKPYRIKADLFEVQLTSKKNIFNYQPLSCVTNTKMLPLGKGLFTYLIKITPAKGLFPKDVLLAYNLHFINQTDKLDLGSLNLLSADNPNAIIYKNMKFPTFFIPKNKDNILFSSCRKLHGKGEDALTNGDVKLNNSYFDLQARPSALFLVGDQIYADDVADPIFPFINQLGQELTGTKEELAKIDNRLSGDNFQRALNQVRGRQYIMEKFCKFTSNKSHNHLISFGEFAAMYLLSYSPEIWDFAIEEDYLQSFDNLVTSEQVYFMFPKDTGYEDEFSAEYRENKNRYEEQLGDLQHFRRTLPQIRRLFANMPTYMMLDDHDITDDFNISLEWKENVENAPLGKHVIANGLAAYWVFQGWGNAPNEYSQTYIKNIRKYMQTYNYQLPSYRIWLDTLLNFDKWSFVAPTNPKALFLDTRTKRSFPIKPTPTHVGKMVMEISSGPQLISETGWKIVSNQLRNSGWKTKSPLILVSPAPFYGIRLIESFLKQYVLPFKMLRLPVQTKFDLEAWRFNGKGYHQFHQWISKWNPSTCTILSGDAHMASAVETFVTFEDGTKRKLHQFTCSPIKNESFSTLPELLLKGILKLHSLTSGSNEVHRSCDTTFRLSFEKDSTKNEASLWKEKINYRSLPTGSIVETNNHLGQLLSGGNEPKVQLLMYNNGYSEERGFN